MKFTLEMCGRTAQCPKCSARFEVPTLEEVREMLGDDISPELEKEFQAARKKLDEYAKVKAAKQAQAQAQAETQSTASSKPHEFEYECPNHDPVKFTLEMCGHTAKCPKCGVRFDVPKLEEVREMLGDQIDAEIEKEFKNAEIKYQEFLKAKAAKRIQLEKEAKEKAEKEEAEKAEQEAREKAEQEAREKAEQEAREKAEQEAREKAELEAKEKAEQEAREKAELEAKESEEAESTKDLELELEEKPNEEMISFLCPNGHQLEAPVSSAGKKGKCPECGAKFKVPSVESMMEAANNELELNSENELSLDEDAAAEQTKTFTEKEAILPPKITVSKDSTERPFLYPNLAIGKTGEIDLGLDEAIRSIPEALKMDPMAKFFWSLWTMESEPASKSTEEKEEEKSSSEETPQNEENPEGISEEKSEENQEEKTEPAPKDFRANIIGRSIKSSQAGKIEIQTADGKIFRPIEFYEDKSLSPIGYFEALDENERDITLVIRWENVVRIIVKK